MKRRIAKKTLIKQYRKWANIIIAKHQAKENFSMASECVKKLDDAFWGYRNILNGVDVSREVKSDINLKWGRKPR